MAIAMDQAETSVCLGLDEAGDMRQLQTWMTETESAIQDTLRNVQKSRTELSSKEAILKQLAGSVDGARRRLCATEKSNMTLSSKLETVISRNGAAERAIKKVDEALVAHSTVVKSLTVVNDKAHTELTKVEQAIATMQSLSRQRLEEKTLSCEEKSLKLKNIQAEEAKLKDDLFDLAEKISSASGNLETRAEGLRTKRESLAALENTVAEEEDELDQKEREFGTCRSTMEEEKSKLDVELNELRDNLHRTNQTRAQLDELQEQLRAKSVENETLKNKLLQEQKSLQECQEACDSRKESVLSLTKTLSVKRAEQIRLETEVNNTHREMEDKYKDILANLEAAIETVKQDINEMEKEEKKLMAAPKPRLHDISRKRGRQGQTNIFDLPDDSASSDDDQSQRSVHRVTKNCKSEDLLRSAKEPRKPFRFFKSKNKSAV